MNQYVTGAVIKELREKKHLTQAELAENLMFQIRLFLNGKQQKAIRTFLYWNQLHKF